MAGHVGKEFVASDGVIQGCPLSVLLLNLLMNTWARSVKAGTTTAMPKVYADDAGVLSKNSEDIDIAFNITGCFATVTQQKLNVDKTKVWGTTETALQSVRNFDLNGRHLDVFSKLKSLGIELSCARRTTNDVCGGTGQERRHSLQAHSLCSSAASSESQLGCVFGWTSGHVWFPASGFTLRLVSSLRTTVVAALWGTKRRSRCREIVLTH